MNVPAGMVEISVRFDQPMNPTGWSVVGGGPHFPADAGLLRWQDDRTFIWPVRLKPDHDYSLSFNHDCCDGFKNVIGEPAVPFSLIFATAPRAGATAKVGINKRALDALRVAFQANDAHADVGGIDWNARFAEHSPFLLAAPSSRSFARAAARLFSVAPDAHRLLSFGGWTYTTSTAFPSRNVDPERLPMLVERWRDEPGGTVSTGWLPGRMAYLRVGEWGAGSRRALNALRSLLAETPVGLVIDVRENVGGDEALAQTLAGCFVTQPTTYALARVLEGGTWIGPVERTLHTQSGCGFPASQVAVLQGPACASSNESFLLMMRAAGALLVGGPSAGSSGRPLPHRLGNGVTAWLPSWIDLAPDGAPIEGRGVLPDVPVAFAPLDAGDTVIDAALRELGSRSTGD